MKKIFILSLVIAALHSSVAFAQRTPITIEKSTTRHGPENGALVIIGGGTVVPVIWDKIIELAGGKEKAKLVIVTNASGDDGNLHQPAIDSAIVRIGKENVSTLHLKTIQESNDPKNLESLRQATGIYFTGGRQWWIADAYLNTLAHQEFLNVLKRGGVIAGSSAGASIQGSFLWRGDTKTANIIIGDHTQGLGFLRNSVIDQHILVRNRQFDLHDFVQLAPQFIGIGLDESTAVVIIKDSLEVIGKSYVAINNAEKKESKANDWENLDSKPFFLLQAGQKYDLKEHQVVRPPRRNPENTTNQTSSNKK
ncbi:MAG: cyanophycinase [Candidatus Symbiothrix sp.]|jgi:cyanophycinase|nr:cyanophycinase [Candidatus Symbiothrix sp.]